MQVAGFDWTSLRQVTLKEISRRNHASPGVSQSSRDLGHDPGERSEEEDDEEMQQRPEIGLEHIPCRNLANQILYLSVEATSPRVRDIITLTAECLLQVQIRFVWIGHF